MFVGDVTLGVNTEVTLPILSKKQEVKEMEWEQIAILDQIEPMGWPVDQFQQIEQVCTIVGIYLYLKNTFEDGIGTEAVWSMLGHQLHNALIARMAAKEPSVWLGR